MRAWPVPPVGRRRSSTGSARPPRSGCTTRGPASSRRPDPDEAGPALRLRHHAVRRHPHGPRQHVRRLRPAEPGLARRRPRRALRAERHRRRRPAARASHRHAARTGATLAERETQLFRDDMDGAVGHPARRVPRARSSRSTSSSRLIQRLQEQGAVYAVDGDLYFSVTADPRFGEVSGLDRDADAGDLRRARRRPRPSGQARPARLPALAAASVQASRHGTARSAAAGRAGTSSAPRSPTTTSATTSTSRAAARTWCSRTTRCRPARPRSRYPGHDFAKAYAHGGMVGFEGHKMSKSLRQPRAGLGAAHQRRRPARDPARPAVAPLPRRLGVVRRRV